MFDLLILYDAINRPSTTAVPLVLTTNRPNKSLKDECSTKQTSVIVPVLRMEYVAILHHAGSVPPTVYPYFIRAFDVPNAWYPSNKSALRLSTVVLLETIKGDNPVATVDMNLGALTSFGVTRKTSLLLWSTTPNPALSVLPPLRFPIYQYVSYQLNLNPFLIEVNPPSSFLITSLSL